MPPADQPATPRLHEPSAFWQRLGAEHADALRDHGFEHFKRRQALRYFTWQWRAGAASRSEQLAFLLRHSSPLTLARAAAVGPAELAPERWAPLPWSAADRWLYVFAIRLLWSYAAEHDPLGVLDLKEPELGDPLLVPWRGRHVSQDLANGALEAAAIGSALGRRAPTSILEVGGGYGRTAYVLCNLWPGASYTIVDIEPAISISRWYLTRLFPDRDLRFVPAAEASSLGRDYDLALSISSLQEMRADQVEAYLRLMDGALRPGGTVYLKQWFEWHNPDDDATLRFADYPFPARWTRLFFETCPVQTRFGQAAWRVP
ncbi:MAG TPA: putative sugar O-methyltransferase [Polyangiaceae bacterium]|nr:putative sugar O-methyltransferase [Polyangiaceae bacterium]